MSGRNTRSRRKPRSSTARSAISSTATLLPCSTPLATSARWRTRRRGCSIAIRATFRTSSSGSKASGRCFSSSAALEDKAALAVDLTNPDIQLGEHDKLPRDTIFLERTKFLWKAVCYERIKIKNYGAVAPHVRLDVLFAADFRDLFEVRGTRRSRAAED